MVLKIASPLIVAPHEFGVYLREINNKSVHWMENSVAPVWLCFDCMLSKFIL